MTKKQREQVYNKFRGLCAYTGKPLGEDWQVDHLKPVFRKMKIVPGRYVHANTGLTATSEELKEWLGTEDTKIRLNRVPSKLAFDGYRNPENNCFENMIPAIKIINHYKRDQDVETFRKYISTLHLRLAQVPKNSVRTETIRRKEYIFKVAELFDITIEKQFTGLFYFETQPPLLSPTAPVIQTSEPSVSSPLSLAPY